MLTEKQYKLLMFINKVLKETGCSPSFEEMKEAVGLKSKSGIHALITALEERNFIKKLPHRARALEVVRLPKFKPSAIIEEEKKRETALQNSAAQIPLYGKIAAGTPIEAIADENEKVSVPFEMVTRGAFYALTIEGDSMVEAGILDGDTVIIKKAETANNGDIVVADQHFGMNEPGGELINFHPGLYQLPVIGLADKMHKPFIRNMGRDNAHIHPALGRDF